MSADKLKNTIADFKANLKGNTITIHSKEYANVAFRVGILRKNLGTDATIKSELIFHDDKRVIVKSEIWIDGKLISTGLAEELRSSSRINQLSALDKVSHLGSYRSWLTTNQKLMQEVKGSNPLAYAEFLIRFNQIKNKLETNGVIQNG